MEYEVVFPRGFKELHGARRCRLRRFSPEAKAVLVQSMEDERDMLVLGDALLISPSFSLALSQEEREALGCPEERSDQDLAVFCRLSVPREDPLAAGFDLSRLVLVDTATGRGLCVSRPLQPFLSLREEKQGT